MTELPQKYEPSSEVNVINIVVNKGDDIDIPISVTDSSGANFDFTNYTGSMLVKRRVEDEDAFKVLDFTTAGSTMEFITGQISLKRARSDLNNLNPGRYYYSIEITNTATDFVETIIKGTFEIKDV